RRAWPAARRPSPVFRSPPGPRPASESVPAEVGERERRNRARLSRAALVVGLKSPLGAISLLACLSARTWPPRPPAASGNRRGRGGRRSRASPVWTAAARAATDWWATGRASSFVPPDFASRRGNRNSRRSLYPDGPVFRQGTRSAFFSSNFIRAF